MPWEMMTRFDRFSTYIREGRNLNGIAYVILIAFALAYILVFAGIYYQHNAVEPVEMPEFNQVEAPTQEQIDGQILKYTRAEIGEL
jgi:hypothetical protein